MDLRGWLIFIKAEVESPEAKAGRKVQRFVWLKQKVILEVNKTSLEAGEV